MITIKKLSSQIEDNLTQMVQRSDNAAFVLQRIILPQYIQAQADRWMSEGASQGFQWKALNAAYKSRKKVRFASYPGSGTKMMIATSDLVDAVLQRNNYSLKMISGKKMTISTSLDYAKHVDDARTFTKFSPEWKQALADNYGTYVRTGDVS